MKSQGEQPDPHDKAPKFPYDWVALNRAAQEGDTEVTRAMRLGAAWLGETNSGVFREWEDLKFLRENWDGPIVLKGIQHLDVSILVDGITQGPYAL